MEINYLKSVDSTQKFLKKNLKLKKLSPPVCIVSDLQTDGIGSRGNSWIGVEGNIFFSFAVHKEFLPNDLPLGSSSIYFSFILKELLSSLGSSLFVKWPNDFYIEEKKIGGTITELVDNILICGIGINIKSPSKEFGQLDINTTRNRLIELFLSLVESYPSWQEIFSKFRVEFKKTKELNTHHNGGVVSLKNAELLDDGSLIIEGKRVLSLR